MKLFQKNIGVYSRDDNMTSQQHLNSFEGVYLDTKSKVLKYTVLHCSNINDVN